MLPVYTLCVDNLRSPYIQTQAGRYGPEILWVQGDPTDVHALITLHPWITRVLEVSEDDAKLHTADYVLPRGAMALHLYLSTYDHS